AGAGEEVLLVAGAQGHLDLALDGAGGGGLGRRGRALTARADLLGRIVGRRIRVAARADLARVVGEVDVREQVHVAPAHARGEVEGAGERRALVPVDDADRHAGGQQRQRRAERRAVERSVTGRAGAVAQRVRGAVAVAEAALER